jgi:hypothetical protein
VKQGVAVLGPARGRGKRYQLYGGQFYGPQSRGHRGFYGRHILGESDVLPYDPTSSFANVINLPDIVLSPIDLSAPTYGKVTNVAMSEHDLGGHHPPRGRGYYQQDQGGYVNPMSNQGNSNNNARGKRGQ